MKKPNKDLCEICEQFKCEISKFKRIQNLKPIKNLENQLKAHINEAEKFYNLKNSLKNNEKQGIICYDFQKNLQIPITNVRILFEKILLS